MLTRLLEPTYTQMLQALSRWFDKAENQMGGAAETLLSSRLADDMYPLATQVRFACVQALEGLSRIQQIEFSEFIEELLNEGRDASVSAGSLADAQGRILQTLALVQELSSRESGVDSLAPIAHTLPNGMIFDLTAEQYVRDWALPQFYFHLMSAYAILRAEGVELGKADYVSHMFAFLRPAAAQSE